MKREWQPGDVAQIAWTNAGGKSDGNGIGYRCNVANAEECWVRISDGAHIGPVTDARPLVVIDPEEDHAAIDFLADRLGVIPARIRHALREFASLTPPKPEEPQGLGARVTDRGGLEWAPRTGLHPAPDGMGMTERRWGCLNGREGDRTWDELLDTRSPLTIEVTQ